MQRVRTGWLRLFCLALAAIGPMTPGLAQNAPGPGEKAPAITLDALTNAPEGAKANWEALGRGTTVIEFWGTWCGPCVAAIPHINDLHDEFAPKGVHFLSVTYEEPELVDRFRERMPMRTWIGHDMDRDMVRAYGVRGWPTTFVVRDGVIVARTHPSSLSKERLAAMVAGKDDPAAALEQPRAAGHEARVGADGRPAFDGFVTAGIDPYSMLTKPDDQPTFQVIVRKAGDMAMGSTSGSSMTRLGSSIEGIISGLYALPSYAVEIDDTLSEKRFDVIYRVPQEQRQALMPLVREMVAAGLGVRLEKQRRVVDAWELRVAEGGLKLEPGLDRPSGSSVTSDGTSLTVTSSSAAIANLANTLSHTMRGPVLDRTGLDGSYFLNLTLPMSADDLPKALEEAAGLVLVPTRHEIEFTIIRPAKD
ncbi:MAG: TIGR03435 family protein [Phycisphaeraceae bacterium]|nr:TIGR03435 family protein [Phycisphaeraceae bacterium]